METVITELLALTEKPYLRSITVLTALMAQSTKKKEKNVKTFEPIKQVKFFLV